MIESVRQRGMTAKAGRELGINERFAQRWRREYKDSEKYPYKKSVLNNGREKASTQEHDQHIRKLIDKHPQIFTDNVVDSLTMNFENLSISKSHLNYLKDKLCLNIKKPTFESADRSSLKACKIDSNNVWNGKIVIFIDEADLNINMRFKWARSASGTRAVVKISKTRSSSHTIIGAIHSSAILHVALRKPSKKEKSKVVPSKKKRRHLLLLYF